MVLVQELMAYSQYSLLLVTLQPKYLSACMLFQWLTDNFHILQLIFVTFCGYVLLYI